MYRVEKLKKIASEHGVVASIKQLGNTIYANVNGVSFAVRGYASFAAMCKELKDYTSPAPIDLTERLVKFEKAFLREV